MRRLSQEQRERHSARERARRQQFTPEQRAAASEYSRLYRLHRRMTDAAHLTGARQQTRAQYQKHRDVRLETTRERGYQLRIACLRAYGGTVPCCGCCGEHNLEFLTLDHINDRRNDAGVRVGGDRVGQSLYAWLRRMNFPLGFRVLCYNCNCSRGARGYCPHELLIDARVEEAQPWL